MVIPGPGSPCACPSPPSPGARLRARGSPDRLARARGFTSLTNTWLPPRAPDGSRTRPDHPSTPVWWSSCPGGQSSRAVGSPISVTEILPVPDQARDLTGSPSLRGNLSVHMPVIRDYRARLVQVPPRGLAPRSFPVSGAGLLWPRGAEPPDLDSARPVITVAGAVADGAVPVFLVRSVLRALTARATAGFEPASPLSGACCHWHYVASGRPLREPVAGCGIPILPGPAGLEGDRWRTRPVFVGIEGSNLSCGRFTAVVLRRSWPPGRRPHFTPSALGGGRAGA